VLCFLVNEPVLASSMSSSRHQIVQIISFTIPNDNTFDDRFSKDGRRWANAMRNIKKQDGWLQTLWGRDVNAFHKLNLFISTYYEKEHYFWRSITDRRLSRDQSGPILNRQKPSNQVQHSKPHSPKSPSPRSRSTVSSSKAVSQPAAQQI